MSKLTLEVGKYYKTRSGDKAYIAAKIKDPFNATTTEPFCGFISNDSGVRTWGEYGHYFARDCHSYFDLTDEWVDPAKATATVFLYRDCHGNLGVSLEMPCKGSEILDSKVVELEEKV
jgi:hypothetical protein